MLKLFKYLFKKLLVSFNVEMNFCKIKYFENLINKLNIENNSEVIDNSLDRIILWLDKNDFIKLFIILNGFLFSINKLNKKLKNFFKWNNKKIQFYYLKKKII